MFPAGWTPFGGNRWSMLGWLLIGPVYLDSLHHGPSPLSHRLAWAAVDVSAAALLYFGERDEKKKRTAHRRKVDLRHSEDETRDVPSQDRQG
ncbi:hypothetical protein [Acidipila sp. EB88]|uniref:hypothetical protein n=1 Tax=Acidipila sp. EB88 TaxID=2305226 RepID=UPI000F5DBD98|nr:hypothetical protein [Acidipila sp. EB88]